jgi:uncharacterized protein YjiS (DUF1127 family)
MGTTVSRTGFAQTTRGTRHVFSFLERYWDAFKKWRKREKLRAELYSLNDNELQDIGIARGEIDYVVSSRAIHRQGVPRSLRYAPEPRRCE